MGQRKGDPNAAFLGTGQTKSGREGCAVRCKVGACRIRCIIAAAAAAWLWKKLLGEGEGEGEEEQQQQQQHQRRSIMQEILKIKPRPASSSIGCAS